ncbi:hypothetical protein [Streptomyces sp. NBC_01373]|uniref:hypothetical protein n=1 Tax=Streptomyces sp. NBC_01373 TaxID=2903843 RepID=UPI00225BD7DF|nr:hypothetical protein [Streptomyces sp. NBC_01373]MCX4699525.1 hypothetical protein [Streptomyces sp. NBC_01373]
MNARTGNGRPRLVASATGRGPVVRAEHHLKLPVDRGILQPGYLCEYYRPFPPGAHVVLDCGQAHVMTTDTARWIGLGLAHCAQITVTGTSDRSARGYVEAGLIFGLDAIARMIYRATADAMEPRK